MSSRDLDWGLGNYGADSDVDQFLGHREGLAITKVCNATWRLRHLKLQPKAIFSREKKGGSANL